MVNAPYRTAAALVVAIAASLVAISARADAVTDWNVTACDAISEARLGTPPANRVMAIVHTAIYEAANAVTRRYPASATTPDSPVDASVEAAVAAAARATLSKLIPSQQAAFDAAYASALKTVPDGPARAAGVVVGEKAAAAVLALRAGDAVAMAEAYRPHTSAGVYVPTAVPAVPGWALRKPWVMTSAAQFRPPPPPALASAIWARDFNEVKALGGKTGSRRSNEQTAIAVFWEATLPPVYLGLVRSVASAPGRDLTRNARFFAAAEQAMDDALIAVFDAKYAYNFWRPVSAIRNGDIDGNDATERDASWAPLIETPMHPEYPCAHCTVAGALGAVLRAEIGTGPLPTLTTISTSAKGASRTWSSIDAFVSEVSEARIYDGVHYRTSAEAGATLGRRIGEATAGMWLERP